MRSRQSAPAWVSAMVLVGAALSMLGRPAAGAEVSFHGELELEFVDAGDGAAEPKGHLGWDKFVLQPKVEVSDTLSLDAQIYFNPGGVVYLNEFHAKFRLSDAVLFDVGNFERYIKDWHGRKTEEYPLLGTAFYRDDYWQAMLAYNLPGKGEPKGFFAALSVGNGLEIDDKQVSTDSSYKVIHDEDTAGGGPFEEWEVGVNVGADLRLGAEGRLGLIGFYYVDRLSGDDIVDPGTDADGLDDLLGASYTTGDAKTRAGGGVKIEPAGGLRIASMFLTADDGGISRSAWFAEVSYKFDFEGGGRLQGIEPVVSYGALTVDSSVAKSDALPGTWDRTKLIVGVLFHLADKMKIKLEYYVNGETTGGPITEFDNNELMVQLEIKF